MTEKKLSLMPYAQAKVRIYDYGTIELVSYTTTVAYIDDGILTVKGLYSATTRKHLSAFAKEYCNCGFATIKELALTSARFDTNTGELYCN